MSTGRHTRAGAAATSIRPAARWSVTVQLTVVLTLLASLSCAGRNESPQESETAGDLLPLAQWIVGQWQITAENGSGPQLTISIDSATLTTLNGHVMRFMSGNTGVGPAEFRPFTGNVLANESMEFTIEMVNAQPSTRIQLGLQRTAADVEVRSFRLGTQSMTANNRVWIARRSR